MRASPPVRQMMTRSWPEATNHSRKFLAILNLTPDSFSDGGNNFNVSSLLKSVEDLSVWPHAIFDVGAESTAPFNAPISGEEELDRLESIFFHSWAKRPELFVKRALSFDTYRVETMRFVLSRLEELGHSAEVYWNDVSGKIDDDVILLMGQFPQLKYILCHNLVPERSLSSSHMDYVKEDMDVVADMKNFFNNTLEKNPGFEDRLVFDPCFGFSKTFDQNWKAIQNIRSIFEDIPSFLPVLIGISRKSFLKKVVGEWNVSSETGNTNPVALETLHALVLGDISRQLQRPLIFRVHDPRVFQACQFVEGMNVGH